MQIIGVDIGFGFTKATDGKDYRVFKSIYGEAVELQYQESLLGSDDHAEHLHLDIDGAAYFVGDLAERQSSSRQFTLEQNQFVAAASKVLALTAISCFATERQQSVHLVVGLPIGNYRQYKAELMGLLRKTHDIIVSKANGERKEIRVAVTDVRVIPQPIGSVMDRLLDNYGRPAERRFALEKIGVIDVGFKTTDYTISDKTRYSERGSMTSQNGIAKAFATIAAKLKDNCGINVELYRLFEAVETGSIKIRGKGYDLKKITQHAFQQLAQNIASDANRIWSDDWDIDMIMITGGGGAVLAPHLQPLLEGVIVPMEQDLDYRLHNVRGYYKYGCNVWPATRTLHHQQETDEEE